MKIWKLALITLISVLLLVRIPSTTTKPSQSPSSSPSPSTKPSISLRPTSSSAPTVFPDCSCGVGEFKFELELRTDEFPEETSWQIEDGNGVILHSESGYNENLKISNYEYCLPVGCHDFVIDDSWGDGICCNGYYKGSVYGRKEVFNGGNFNETAIEHFCGEDLCPFATYYPSTSPSVSLIPSMDPIRPMPNTPFYIHTGSKTWDECKKAAENNGYTFASIRSQEENAAVFDYLLNNGIWAVWLGGYQTSFEDEPAGNWAWLDGTSWTDSTYTNWHPSQPDNWNDGHHLEL